MVKVQAVGAVLAALEKPYIGRAITALRIAHRLDCGGPSLATRGPRPRRRRHGDDVAHYTCSMHPSVAAQQPGKCPICSMDLVAGDPARDRRAA